MKLEGQATRPVLPQCEHQGFALPSISTIIRLIACTPAQLLPTPPHFILSDNAPNASTTSSSP